MKAYKGFYKDSDGRLYCSPKNNIKFYYEEGKTYETDKAKLCHYGFHVCTLTMDVFKYYNSYCGEVEFHEVELEGVTDERRNDSKVCGTKITIGRKITPDEMVERSIIMIMAEKDKYFVEDKLYKIRKDTKYNFINTDGDIISDEWLDEVWCFNEGLSKVHIKNKGWNFINTNGMFISEVWFNDVGDFDGGLAKVRISGKGWNLIREDGKILRDDLWFDNVWIFNEGLAKVRFNNKFNFINTDGNIISDVWFDIVHNFYDGVAVVWIDDEFFRINTKGEIVMENK